MASEKITKLMDDVKSLTVLELNELVKALEEEFGVTAAAPVAAAGAVAGGAAAGAAGRPSAQLPGGDKRNISRVFISYRAAA